MCFIKANTKNIRWCFSMCCSFGIRWSKWNNGMSTKKFKSLNLHAESLYLCQGYKQLAGHWFALCPLFYGVLLAHLFKPFILSWNVSAVSISRLSLKDRALEQISNFKPLFALALCPSLFPFTNVWAVVFRTGCAEGRVFGAYPVLVLEVGWRQASSSFWGCKIVQVRQRTGFVSPWDLLASWAPCHISESGWHPWQSQVTSALSVQRYRQRHARSVTCNDRPTQNLLIHVSMAFE